MNPELQHQIVQEPKKRSIRLRIVQTVGMAPSVVAGVLGLVWSGFVVSVTHGTAADIAVPFLFIALAVFIIVLMVDGVIQFLLWSKPEWLELYVLLTRIAFVVWLILAIQNGEFSAVDQEIDVFALI